MNSIKKLSKSTSSLIKSSQISAIPSIILDLVLNSIDAHSTSIWIQLNLNRKSIVILDNGMGILPSALSTMFQEKGMIGNESVVYGKKGEFIRDLGVICELDMVSRTKVSQAYQVVVKNGVVKTSQFYTKGHDIGTRVSIQDLFNNIPVRRQIETINLKDIKNAIEPFIILYPNISFHFSDTLQGQHITTPFSVDNKTVTSNQCKHQTSKTSLDQFLAFRNESVFHSLDFIVFQENLCSISVRGFIAKTLIHLSSHSFIFLDHYPIKCESLAQMILAFLRKYTSIDSKNRFPVYAIIIETSIASTCDLIRDGTCWNAEIEEKMQSQIKEFLFKLFKIRNKPSKFFVEPRHSLPNMGNTCALNRTEYVPSHMKSSDKPSETSFTAQPVMASNIATSILGQLWIQDALIKWKNPIHAVKNTELPFEAIPAASIALSKKDLENVQVICQYDKKFILCVLYSSCLAGAPSDASMEQSIEASIKANSKSINYKAEQKRKTLLLFDQHAVDERIQLETILNTMRNPHTLRIPILLQFDATETCVLSELEKTRMMFAYWAIEFSVCPEKNLVSVHKVPEPVKRRFVSDSRLLKHVLTGSIQEIGNLRSHSQIPSSLFQIAQSVACRSSVMFGDELEIEKCSLLIKELANCKFPFQCAHGRPSVYPLLEMESCHC